MGTEGTDRGKPVRDRGENGKRKSSLPVSLPIGVHGEMDATSMNAIQKNFKKQMPRNGQAQDHSHRRPNLSYFVRISLSTRPSASLIFNPSSAAMVGATSVLLIVPIVVRGLMPAPHATNAACIFG